MAGGNITDNILIAFEAIHYKNIKSHGKHGDVAIKIDFSKAYGRIDWRYSSLFLFVLALLENGSTGLCCV